MAKYDSPGFAGAFPTGEMLDAGSLSNAQGSTSAGAGMAPADVRRGWRGAGDRAGVPHLRLQRG